MTCVATLLPCTHQYLRERLSPVSVSDPVSLELPVGLHRARPLDVHRDVGLLLHKPGKKNQR